MTEDRKFAFWPNNRGDNLSKRVNNRTGEGEKGTSELCPSRRGKFEVQRREWLSAKPRARDLPQNADLPGADKNPVSSVETGFSSEGDGARTRNHRIDSPVL